MELLLHWMRKQGIDENKIWAKPAIEQECFLRDVVCRRLLHTHAFVVSAHTSKSIKLPVYTFTMRNGIKVICRENFYGWKLSVSLPKLRPYENIIPEDLFQEGYDENIPRCHFEGFKEDWIFEGYKPNDIYQTRFSFGIRTDYDFYVVMYTLNRLYDEEDFTEGAKKLTKDYIVCTIKRIYDKFGYNEMISYEGVTVRAVSGSDIFTNTYFALYDFEFRKAKGIDFIDTDIFDNVEELAEYIIKYPEVGKVFLAEVKSYNFEF